MQSYNIRSWYRAILLCKIHKKIKEPNPGDPDFLTGVYRVADPALLNKRFFRGGRGYLKVNTVKLILLTNGEGIGSDFVR